MFYTLRLPQLLSKSPEYIGPLAANIGQQEEPTLEETTIFLSKKLHFQTQDARKLDFESAMFDAGFCNFGLGYLDEWEPAVHELMRVVKLGNPIVLVQPTQFTRSMPYYVRDRVASGGVLNHINRGMHPSEMKLTPNEKELMNFVHQHGLTVDKIDGGYGYIMDVFVLKRINH